MEKEESNELMVQRSFDNHQPAITNIDPVTYEMILGLIDRRTKSRERILVRYKDKIMPFSLSEIALFYLENELTYLVTQEGRSYIIQKNLEEVERFSAPCFFRVNRQFVINKSAIRDLSATLTRSLTVNLKFSFMATITVSKSKAAAFMEWMIEGPEPYPEKL